MTLAEIVTGFTLIFYNIATAIMIAKLFKAMDLEAMLREKKLDANIAPPPANQEGANDAAATNQGNSYSRITGAVGSVVLVTFIWGVGTAVLFNSFMAPDNVAKMLTNVGPFILSASALFAPYAFNQLSTLFPSVKK